MKSFRSIEQAFTGLEAAIILVAFVVVAAVFSFIVLGGGFFTAQTAQATVHSGVGQASSSMEIDGDIMGIDYNTDGHLTYINISVANTAGGTGMDLSQMVVSYSDNQGNRLTNIYNNSGGISSCTWRQVGDTNILTHDAAYPEDVHWCVSQKINDRNPSSPNDMLEPGEVWILSIEFPYPGTPDTRFTMYFQPSVGAPLSITRGLPGAFTKIQPLR